MSIIVTQQNFQSEVLDAKGYVLIDFCATWCGPCQMLAPIIDEIAAELKDLKIVKIDVDSQPQLASQYNVSSVPTVIIFKDGQLIETLIGFRQKSDYLKILKK
jgi:thioredoxin 1